MGLFNRKSMVHAEAPENVTKLSGEFVRIAYEIAKESNETYVLDYSDKSLIYLDKFIDLNIIRKKLKKRLVTKMTALVAAYFGELIRKELGGQWEKTEKGYQLKNIGGKNVVVKPADAVQDRLNLKTMRLSDFYEELKK